jgi:hypothetical protein
VTVNSERRKLIAVVAVAAAAVVIVAAGAAAIGWLADRDDETVVTQEPTDEDAEPEADDATDDATTEDDASTDDEPAEDDVTEGMTPMGGDVLPEPMGGQEAIDALGDDLQAVAELNNRDVDELRELLLRDHTLRISPNGFLFYIDTATPNLPDDDS